MITSNCAVRSLLTAALGAALALVAAGPAVAAQDWPVSRGFEDGIPVIGNPATPRDGADVVSAREAWRFGADEANDPLLGRITDVVVDDTGHVYLLDANLSQIHVMSPDGSLVRTIGREGDGPGEFRNSSELVMMPDGDLGIMEMMPGNVVIMDIFGEPRDSFHPGDDETPQMMLPQHIAADARGVVLGYVATTFGEGSVTTAHILARYLPDGSLVQTLIEHREEQSGGNISLSLGGGDDDFARNWTLGSDGRVIVYRHAYDYELQVYGEDSRPELIIRRQYETMRRPEEELATARRQAEEMNRRFHGGVRQEVEERARDINAVYVRPGGELWVATSAGIRNQPEATLATFDVIDKDGLYVRTVRIDGVQYDRERDEYLIRGNQLFILRESRMVPPRTSTSGGAGMQMVMITGSTPDPEDEGDSGPLEVVCYKLGR